MRKSQSLSREIFGAVTHDLIGGLMREAGRQVLGFRPAKKKKQAPNAVHNHYHIHPDKKYYKAR